MATVVAEVRFQQLGVHAHTSVVLAGEDSEKPVLGSFEL